MNAIDIGPMNSFQAEGLVAELKKINVPFEVLSANSKETLPNTNLFGQVMNSNLVLIRLSQDEFAKNLSLFEAQGFTLLTKIMNPAELQEEEEKKVYRVGAESEGLSFLEKYFTFLQYLLWICLFVNFTDLRHNRYFQISLSLVVFVNFVVWVMQQFYKKRT